MRLVFVSINHFDLRSDKLFVFLNGPYKKLDQNDPNWTENNKMGGHYIARLCKIVGFLENIPHEAKKNLPKK